MAREISIGEEPLNIGDGDHPVALHLAQLPLEDSQIDPAPSYLVALARAHHLTTYDASYPIAAAQHGYHLATRDEKLRATARAEGVALVG